MSDIVPVHRWRTRVPEAHRSTLDTRLIWLWHQRFGTVQMVYKESPDLLDKTAATVLLQAIIGRDLESIKQVFQRLEGGSVFDKEFIDSDDEALRV